MGRKAERRCQLTGAVSLVIGAMLLKQCSNTGTAMCFLNGIGGLFALALAAIVLDMSRRKPADSHTIKGLIISYLMNVIIIPLGYFRYNKLRKGMKDVETSQHECLMKILLKQAETVYGKEYGFRFIKDRTDFRKNIPLATYSHFHPYTERMADGENNVLTVDKVEGISTSSGTTGKSKLIPFTNWKEQSAYFVAQAYLTQGKFKKLALGKVVLLLYKPRVRYGKTGIPIAPLSFHLTKYFPLVTAPSPAQVITSVDNEQTAIYLHAVFGLAEREVSGFHGSMSTLSYSFWKLVEMQWEDICDDIEAGQLKKCPSLHPDLKNEILRLMKPDPERAEELRQEFRAGMEGICLRIWPYCNNVMMLTTGGFAHHARILAEGPLKGVTLVSGAHSSSEAVVGLNLSPSPDDLSYHLLLTLHFYEFIPENECAKENPLTYFADQVEIGKSYEVVLTTSMGLYRYRLGDVVKIISKSEGCPVYEFQYRLGQLLNLYWEKTPESVFYAALEQTATALGITVADYTACEDYVLRDMKSYEQLDLIDPSKKFYVLFLETSCEKDEQIVAHNKEQFDKGLCDKFEIYADLRRKGSVGPMQVIQVRSGTFLKLKERLIRDTQNPQFKMPRVMRSQEAFDILFKHIIT